jgi:CDP-paratose synthetase
MRILITGPDGTIANKLIAKMPIKFKIYTISSKIIKPNSKILENFIYKNDYLKLKKYLFKIKPKIIIHLSTKWKKFDDQSNKDLIDSNITFGSYLLDISSSLKLKIFINTSSYSQINSKGIFKPFNFYSASKESFTNVLYYFFLIKKFNVINLRVMNVYGTYPDKRIVNYIFNHIKNKKKVIYVNDANAYIDLIHIDDVVSGIVGLLVKNNYNDYKKFSYDLSSKKQIKIIDLIKTIESISAYKFKKIVSKKIFDQYIDIPYRDKRLINWNNNVNLIKGLKENYDFFFP